MTAETLLRWVQIALIVSGFVTAGLSAVAWRLSVNVNAAKNRESNQKIVAAEVRAAEANALASQARLELENLTKPRTSAPGDQEQIVVALKQFAGQRFAFSVFEDPEALALLRVLDATLKSAGWVRVSSQIGDIGTDVAGDFAGFTSESGVAALVGPDNREAETTLLTLSKTLTDAGTPCRPIRTEQLRGKTLNAIVISVGKKPM